MPESEEALLRRAAERVRAVGEYADGPWTDEGCTGIRSARGVGVVDDAEPSYAAWIALVGPQCAEPLAAWLESEADWKAQDPGVVDPEAIAVARTLLGEPARPHRHRGGSVNDDERRAVWDVLVEECGAYPGHWDQFDSLWLDCGEFRFQGSLGFGGKIYRGQPTGRPATVDCYREDSTPERDAAIERANARLAALVAPTVTAPEGDESQEEK